MHAWDGARLTINVALKQWNDRRVGAGRHQIFVALADVVCRSALAASSVLFGFLVYISWTCMHGDCAGVLLFGTQRASTCLSHFTRLKTYCGLSCNGLPQPDKYPQTALPVRTVSNGR